ncbi:hypothetical protein SSS_07378 [Sarcoptes scabiei]|uniref:Uncharacterized protein n=1 Tax=Sarcoptes scabiei TaxID=52283 RepID=A0A834RGJ3_SARSC|nr:hypothetical protein SSS_07378 [Sarcoptes scabiei]
MSDGDFKPGVAAIIIIALGILIFTLLFIFAKRQIMRLAQKFPTEGNNTIVYDAPKNFCLKIEKRLDGIKNIHHEPLLINSKNEYSCEENASLYKHIYRMKSMDLIKDLEDSIVNACERDKSKRKHPRQDLKSYLQSLQTIDGPLCNCDPFLIDQFVEQYDHARFDSEPDFGLEEYQKFLENFEKLRSQIVPISKAKNCPTKISSKKISRSLASNLSFKNLANISSSSKNSSTKQNDETCV